MEMIWVQIYRGLCRGAYPCPQEQRVRSNVKKAGIDASGIQLIKTEVSVWVQGSLLERMDCRGLVGVVTKA